MAPPAPVIIVKKKGGHGGGHHGGAWKVAYADFVTAMMAFFLVMWLVTQSKDTKAAVAGYFRDPGAFTGSKSILPGAGALGADPGGTPKVTMTPSPDASGAGSDRQSLLATADRIREDLLKVSEFKTLRDQIEITVTSEGLRIELVEREGSSFFDSGSAVLKGESERVLAVIAHELQKLTNDVLIEGHTDRRAYASGDRYGNWELSADRANSARRVVESKGLNPGQVRGIRGYADTQLHIVKDPFDPRNRRISIVVRSESAKAVEQSAMGVPESKPVAAVAQAVLDGHGAAPAPPARHAVAPVALASARGH